MTSQRKDINSEEVSDEFLERFADLLWQSLQEQPKNEKRELTDRPLLSKDENCKFSDC